MKHRRTTSELPIPHSRLVLWFGILTLLLSLSAQIMGSQQVLAQDLQPQTLQSDDTNGEGQEGQDGQNGQEAQQEQAVAPTYVQIEKYDCPVGSDWSQADYGTLLQNCGQNQTPVNVTVAGQVQSITNFGQWGPYDGLYNFDISEEERPGYGAPHVFCSPFVPDVSGPNLSYAGTSNFINWTVQPGESLYCQMFNYQTAQQNGIVVIRKYFCPDDWKLQDPYQAQLQELSSLCTSPMPNVQIAVEQNGSALTTLQTGQDGVASWDQVPSGPTTLREFLPPGYGFGVVHCTYYPATEGNGAATSQAMSMQDATSFAWDIQPGYVLDCFWFNFPADQLQLYKYWCPDSVLSLNGNATFEDFRAMCSEQPASQIGWRIEQTSNNQTIGSVPASSGVPGYAGYHSFSQDQEIRIIEEIAADSGYGVPIVYCFEYQRGNPTGQPYPVVYSPDTGINWTPKAGNYLVCSFFNVKNAEGGSILVEKYWCPEGLAFVQAPTQADLQSACQESGSGAMFSLEGPGNAPQTWESKTAEGGPPASVLWDKVPEGEYVIREMGLDSTWSYVVFCHASDGTQNGAASVETPLFDGNGVQVSMKVGYTVACAWFNTPIADGDYNYIDFYKYECPDTAPRDADKSYYEANCKPAAGWEFKLSYVGGDTSGTTDVNGYVGWSGIPIGTFQSSEAVPEGWSDPIVYCRYTEWPQEAGVTGEWAMFQAPAGAYENGFGYEGMRIECHWYNFAPTAGDYNYIDFYKYVCPIDAPVDADKSYYEANCKPVEDWQFDMQWTGGGSTQSTDASGYAGWSGAPIGQWQASETLPEGYGEPIVYCRYIEWPDGIEIEEGWVRYTAPGGVYGNDFKYDTMRIECHWYNFAPTDGNTVTIYKWDCAPGTEYGREQAYYMGALPDQDIGPCETEHLNIPITMMDGSGSYPTTTQANGTQWAVGSLDPSGSFQVMEEIPAGYGDPMVFCSTTDDNGQTMVPSVGGAIAITPSTGSYAYQCNWYNIPTTTTDNSVTIYKWDCAPGTEYGREQDYYMGALQDQDIGPCESEHLNIPITLLDGGGSYPTTTQANGTQWSGVVLDQGGGFQVVEEIPSGYGDPMVFCGTLDEDVQTVTPSTGGTIAINPSSEPFTYQCNWYNIPTDVTPADPGTNWITIYKYVCGPEAPVSDDLGAMQAACTDFQSGVNFTLEGPSGFTSNTQSTVGGVAEWSGLYAGNYTVMESVPPGYGEPKIWCGYTAIGGVTIEDGLIPYDQYTAQDGAIQTNLESENSRLVCYWFNFPSPESTVTVYKYNCTYEPAGFPTLGGWQEACPTVGDGFTFSLTDSTATSTDMVTSGGSASWSGVPEGDFTLSETLQSGWGEPVVWCGFTAFSDGAVIDAFPMQVPTLAGGSVSSTISYPGTSYFCFWFNIPDEKSSITIYKYNCPEGPLEGEVLDPFADYTNQCHPASDGIQFNLSNANGDSSASTLGGMVSWSDVPSGAFTITETLPQGYDPPIWFCEAVVPGVILADVSSGPTVIGDASYSGSIDVMGTKYYCWVFDFPSPDRTVEVYKWLCPEGYEGGESHDAWMSNCTMPMNNVSFSVTDVNGIWTQPTVAGSATWYGVGQGDVTLREHIPPGYFEPVYWCSLEAIDGAAFAEDWTYYPSTDGTISRSLNYSEFKWVCNVYNLPKGKGSITINKWLCPPGYDLYGWGSDPYKDCAQRWDGITFTLDQPVGPNLQSNTGDSIPGAVFFGGLEPGSYVVTESVPSNIDHVFVLDCYGSDVDKVHPYPLKWGNGLTVQVAGGDEIVCNWYNVPKPTKGWLTIYKYQCWTPVYTSEVDCEIYEFGATFELFTIPGNVSMGSGTTNSGGVYTWSDLEAGSYKVKEISHTPCRITTTKKDSQGNIKVDVSQGTIVKIYNCKPKTPGKPGTPTVPGKPPGKYPNTGVDPASVNAVGPVAVSAGWHANAANQRCAGRGLLQDQLSR